MRNKVFIVFIGQGKVVRSRTRALHEPMQKNKSQKFQSAPIPCCDGRWNLHKKAFYGRIMWNL